ncbi:MAG TPA: hypothetical protein VJ853_12080 [Thermoanaerobaculia bacterium]|nr:hypothetical protein [Thermoanaerobaculia bacterium]
MTPRAEPASLDMLPPADWWRVPQIADAVRPSADQVAQLEKISQDQGNDVSRIENDMTIAMRDLRTQLDAASPSQNDIITAGNRIRDLRNAMFDRQLQMLAAERTVLTRDQWQSLQDALRNQREQRNDYYPRRGGRGMGGRGRWPGY